MTVCVGVEDKERKWVCFGERREIENVFVCEGNYVGEGLCVCRQGIETRRRMSAG